MRNQEWTSVKFWNQAHQKNTKPPSAPAVIKDLLHRFNNIKTLCHRKRRVRGHQSHAKVTHASCWPRPPSSLSPSTQKSLLTFMYKYIQFIDDCCWAVWGRGFVCVCVGGVSALKFCAVGFENTFSLGERPVGGANPNGAHASVAQPNAGFSLIMYRNVQRAAATRTSWFQRANIGRFYIYYYYF